MPPTCGPLKAGSASVVRCRCAAACPSPPANQALVPGRIGQLPANSARDIEQYLAAVREAGLIAEDVEIRKADLEDVFLEVMAAKPEVAA